MIEVNPKKTVFLPHAGSNSDRIPISVLQTPESQLQLYLVSQDPMDMSEEMWSPSYMRKQM